MTNNFFLASIPELNFTGKISSKTDAQFASYVNDLNSFVDYFSEQSRKIKNALIVKNIAELRKELTNACESLEKIHADDLVMKFKDAVSYLTEDSYEDVVTFTEMFLSSVSSLSIEIQMAMHKGKQNPSSQTASNRITVLAVDNAKIFLNTLKKLLANTSYELVCVTTGREALDLVESIRPNLVLLDIEMPEMDGYELAREIKKRTPRIPILFVTANSDREFVDKAVEVGAAGLLMKPLRVNQLLEKIREIL
jgi:CheY-like chemotaxis protein